MITLAQAFCSARYRWGILTGLNLAGRAHPSCSCAGGLTHGVLLMNSNGMDIVITDSKISYRIIGGVADFYFFLGPTPNAVLEQLTYIVGRPMMAPYWSLGLMNSK